MLETERLIIERATLEDARFFFQLMNSPNWLEFIGDRGIRSEKEAREYIQRSLMDAYHLHGYGLYKIILKDSKLPIGICGFVKRDYLESADLGFAILPDYSGNGYVLEAAKAVMAYGVTILNLNPILAVTTEMNLKSRRLLTKLGFRETGKVKPPGSEVEFLLFSTRAQKPKHK